MAYDVHAVDWIKYLDRKQPLFLFASFIRPYGVLLKETCGVRFHHQLQFFAHDSGTFIKSATEMKMVDDAFLRLVRAKDARLAQWASHGMALNKEVDMYIEAYRSGIRMANRDTYWQEFSELCESVMLFDTVIPYRILSAINATADSAGIIPEDLRYTQELFEPFRAGAKYPQLVEHVFPHFWKCAADVCSIEDASVLSLVTPLELRAVMEGSLTLSPDILAQRKEWCAFWEDPETGNVQFSYDKKSFSHLDFLR